MISAMKSQDQEEEKKQLELQDLLEETDSQDKHSGDIIPQSNDNKEFNNSDEDFIEQFEDFGADREIENEEVYDYFLDTQKDENHNEN